jgi:aryl-alcohol dehydrogenase-like predicted oxidoreductase
MQDDTPVLERCEAEGIAYLPFFPLGGGRAVNPAEENALDAVAVKHGVTKAQAALAWMLRRSPAVLAIPGTSSVAHLDENVAAAAIVLDDEDMRAIGS